MAKLTQKQIDYLHTASTFQDRGKFLLCRTVLHQFRLQNEFNKNDLALIIEAIKRITELKKNEEEK